jgi:hypothetical protein
MGYAVETTCRHWPKLRCDLIEFLHRLFTRDNVYCMSTCFVFMALWFHFSRNEDAQVLEVEDRRRKQQPLSHAR